MRIAFAGNPNSGKTTMYNALTGRNERVGNWAGVTVERKESLIKRTYYDGGQELVAVDLPGAYSMSPFTSEESITSSYVKNENPDAIINIVDATNLSRSLFFTTQLLELGSGKGAVLAGGHRDNLQAGDVTVFIGHEAFGGGRVVDGDLGLLLFGALEVHGVGGVDVLAALFHGGGLLVGAGEGRPRAVVRTA